MKALIAAVGLAVGLASTTANAQCFSFALRFGCARVAVHECPPPPPPPEVVVVATPAPVPVVYQTGPGVCAPPAQTVVFVSPPPPREVVVVHREPPRTIIVHAEPHRYEYRGYGGRRRY